MSDKQPCYIGFRRIQDNGGSVVVSIPATAVREEFGVEPEDIQGEDVSASLYNNGDYKISLGPVVDD